MLLFLKHHAYWYYYELGYLVPQQRHVLPSGGGLVDCGLKEPEKVTEPVTDPVTAPATPLPLSREALIADQATVPSLAKCRAAAVEKPDECDGKLPFFFDKGVLMRRYCPPPIPR
ncbi:hypothetical protein ABVT39_022383 [Epinephelus coioides]